jgi:hypothetical protein
LFQSVILIIAVINFFLFAAKTSKVDPIDENVAVKTSKVDPIDENVAVKTSKVDPIDENVAVKK